MTRPVTVLAAPLLDPGAGRLQIELPAGLTLAEMLEQALPGLDAAGRAGCRIALSGPGGLWPVAPALWHRVRPQPGIQVVIRAVPADGALRSVLSIVVSIAAVAIGGLWGAGFGAALGIGTTAGTAALTLGASILGTLALNALIPPPKPLKSKPRYQINGLRNTIDPDGAVPMLLGQLRFAPPFAALPYTEIVGDWQYIRAVFVVGEGRCAISDLRIGDTSIDEYDEIEVEIREGLPEDAPLGLYPRQVAEEAVGTELTRPLPRDDRGRVDDSEDYEAPDDVALPELILPGAGGAGDVDGIETPVVRATGADAAGASVILGFPSGIYRVKKDGNPTAITIRVRIDQRPIDGGDDDWEEVTVLAVRAKKLESFFRQFSWDFPSRGRWQVRCTMLTKESTSPQSQRRTVWAALQTLRPEYPINYPRPLALIAVRIKATHQLNGQLDTVNTMAARICPDYDADTGSWIVRETSNPAALYRHALQCGANPRPVADAGLWLDQIEDWHRYCAAQDLTYDRLLDDPEMTLREALAEIAAAGRATPRHDGLRWGVVIDRPQDLVVDEISPRNSREFRGTRSYLTPPHAWRIPFMDATNDYKPAERLVRWPGHEGDILLTEELPMPGVVWPDTLYREGIRRAYEAIHRPDTYTVMQDGRARCATRGDLVMVSQEVLLRSQVAARVRQVAGQLVLIDEAVTMAADTAYAVRYRVGITAEDVIGTSVVRPILTEPGAPVTALTLTGEGPPPRAGDLIHIGPAAQVSLPMIVTGVEAAQDGAWQLRLADAAPQIETLTEATPIPPWSGRVGAEVGASALPPAAPVWVSIDSGVAGTAAPDLITVLVAPGSGGGEALTIEIEHRLVGAPGWTTVSVAAAQGAATIDSYAHGDPVELRPRAISVSGIAGPYGPLVTLTVGEADAPQPLALDPDTLEVQPLLGGARVIWETGDDPDTVAVQVYRATAPVLDPEADAVGEPVAVVPGRRYELVLGDETRTNLVYHGDFDLSAGWTTGAGWSIAGGIATHAPGAAGTLSRTASLSSGRSYRLAVTVSGRSAGTLTPGLSGLGDPGTPRAADGIWLDRLEAGAGATAVTLAGDADFDGSVDDVVVYRETAACLAQGTHHIWLAPINADGTPGPASGPIIVTII